MRCYAIPAWVNLLNKTYGQTKNVSFFDLQIWPPAVLQPLELQGYIVTHLKVVVIFFQYVVRYFNQTIVIFHWIAKIVFWYYSVSKIVHEKFDKSASLESIKSIKAATVIRNRRLASLWNKTILFKTVLHCLKVLPYSCLLSCLILV